MTTIPDHDRLTHQVAQALAPALADLDGNPWEYRPPTEARDWTATAYIGCGNQELAIRAGHWQHPGRVYMNGSYPRDDAGHYVADYRLPESVRTAPSITVAATKTPEQMAKDVARRLLPAYRDRLAAVLWALDQDRAYHDRRDDHARQVAEWSAGTSYPCSDPTAADRTVRTGSGETVRVSGTYLSLDRVSFNLTDPTERARAERVARALAE